MGGTTLHACIVAHWFEMLLVLLFQRYTTMVVNGILFGVMGGTTLHAGIVAQWFEILLL